MKKSKIPSSSRLKPPGTLLPIPKSSIRVPQAAEQTQPCEDPIRQPSARRLLSRRSKSFSDLRPNLKPEFHSRRPNVDSSSDTKMPQSKPVAKSTSTSNLCGRKAREPLFQSVLKTTPETSKGAMPKQPSTAVRTTVKQPATGSEDASNPKVSKPAKIPPYDYKARLAVLSEKHMNLVQTFRETKQKIVDTEKDLQDYGVLKEDHLKLQAEFAAVSEERSALKRENSTLVEERTGLRNELLELTSAHRRLKEDFEALRSENLENLSRITELQEARNKLDSELQVLRTEHDVLQRKHSSLQADQGQLKHDCDCLAGTKQRLKEDLGEARCAILSLQSELHECKSSLHSQEEPTICALLMFTKL